MVIAIIYKTTHLPDGKIYIGQHRIKNQKTLDSNYLGSGSELSLIISKYRKLFGRKFIVNFEREVLHYIKVDNQKVIDKLEEHYIRKYDSCKLGYNILPGTANNFGMGSMSRLTSVRIKISKSRKGKYCGTEHHMFGKHWDEETKSLNSESNKGKQAGDKHWNYGNHWSLEHNKSQSDLMKGKQLWLGKTHTKETKLKLSAHFTGKTWSENSKIKMSNSMTGNKNPLFGKIRITNGILNSSLGKDEEIPAGWKRGLTEKRNK